MNCQVVIICIFHAGITCFFLDKPVIDKKRSSSSIAAQAGETILLKCNATGNPFPLFEWRKGDVVIGTNPTISVKMSASTDFGKYSCRVYNFVASIRYDVQVFKVGKSNFIEFLLKVLLNIYFLLVFYKNILQHELLRGPFPYILILYIYIFALKNVIF